MRKLSGIIFTVLLFSFISVSNAYSELIIRLIDAYSKNPISGATVYLQPKNEVLVSDDDGICKTTEDINLSVLEISIYRLGYFRLTKSGFDSSEITIALEPQPINLETITLHASTNIPERSQFTGERLLENLPADVADVFANRPGFGVVRKGSYGSDPVINGFKREAILVQIDGAGVTECACPNRMDPLTTQIQPEDLSEVQVVEGPYSLRYGTTVGGLINLKMDKPRPGSKTNGWHGNLYGRYESNGDGKITRATLERIGNSYGTKISGGIKSFNSYADGDGNDVPSGFDVFEFSILQSLKLKEKHDIDIFLRKSYADDILYAGLPMDAQQDDATIGQLTWRWNNPANGMAYFELSGYSSSVDHIMHNHNRPNYAMVDAIATTESSTSGVRFEFLLSELPKGIMFVGMDYDIIYKAGERQRIVYTNPCSGMVLDPPAHLEDKIWQDSHALTFGLFTEYQARINPQTRFSLSTRIDQFMADALDPATQFEERFANNLENKNLAFSASSSIERQLDADNVAHMAIGYGTRFPSITELYINHLTVGQDAYEYFGNPKLEPEKNFQVTLGLNSDLEGFRSKFNVYTSYLTDMITAEVDPSMARLYVPCSDPQSTKRFVNLSEAVKYGFDWSIGLDLSHALHLHTSLAYTWAENIADNEPLPEIPPFEIFWSLRYDLNLLHGSWVMFQGRHVSDQNRIAENFAEEETDGFNVYHFRTGIKLNPNLEFITGVRNIFDKQYREHLNRNYKNQFVMSPLYEPGRNVYVQLKMSF